METTNILSEGLEGIQRIKDQVLTLECAKKKVSELQEEEKLIERQLKENEKAVMEEVTATQKKRRNEIEASFDEQIEGLSNRIKKVKSKKEKEKDVGVSKRIKDETKDKWQERVRLKHEIKAVYEKNHIPLIFNNPWIYALYLPIGIKDILIIVLTLIVTLLLIPVGLYMLLFPQKPLVLAVIYFITVIVFGGIYFVVYKKLREEKKPAISEVRRLRRLLVKNIKQIKSTAKAIRKDQDESGYHLDDYTQEIDQLTAQMQACMDQKKDAIVEFETTTIKELEAEIRSHTQSDNDDLTARKHIVYEEQKKAEQEVRQTALTIANQYEVYIGKDMLTITNLDHMAEMIQAQEVSDIGEAIQKIKNDR